MSTHGDRVMVWRDLTFGHSSSMRSALSDPSRLQRDCLRRTAQKGGRKCIAEPAQIGGKPFNHLEPAGAMLTLEPQRRHLADAPAQPVRLHQQLDAVAKSLIRLALDLF